MEPDATIARACDARLPQPRRRSCNAPLDLRTEASLRRTLVIVLATAVVGGVAGAAIGLALDRGSSEPGPTSAGSSASVGTRLGTPLDPEHIYRSDSPGVVVITDNQTQVVPASLFSPAQKEQVTALGSGFVIDARGDIVTNDHVVQGAEDIRIGFSGGASYPAKIVGTDPSTDIAVVRVTAPASVLHPLQFAVSSNVETGDPAYAIGNPFGLERTMTAGIISATGRDIQAPNGLTIPDAIQTDAPINHGNSGGPLLDRFGHVIGINAQIEGGTVDANVGVGFAIPTATARSIADQLIATGHAEHAWLGVQVATIDPSVSKVVRGLPPNGVVVVKVVKGSPAAKAGLEAARPQVNAKGITIFVGADAIVAVDGEPISSTARLSAIVAQHKPGDTLELQVVRGGTSRTVDVRLGNAPA
jgi:putative serine protease PepD